MKRWFHRPLTYIIACYGLEIIPCSAQTQEAQELAPVKVEGRPYGEEIIGQDREREIGFSTATSFG
jgi:hypothetical protein